MNKMNKILFNKGFTLIELLAVIVVLSIILTISVPKIFNAVEEADKESFRLSAETLINEAIKQSIISNEQEKTYTITNGSFVGDEIPTRGELPDNGTIHVVDENVDIAVYNDKWCAIKYSNDKKVSVSKNITCELEIPEVVDETCFSWTPIGSNARITGYSYGCSYKPIIPDTLGGLRVTEIAQRSFSSKNLSNVLIPSSVTNIGYYAFAWNRISYLSIPDSVTNIDSGAFYDNNITNLKLSNNLSLIGSNAFANNLISDLKIPEGVEEIGNGSFNYNLINKLSIPNSVVYIGDFAFQSNQIRQLSIQNNVTYMGYSSFNDNQLSDGQAFIYARDPQGNIDYGTLVSYGGAKKNNIIIPSSVTNIGYNAFSYSQISSITIPNTVNEIWGRAFAENELTSITIPNSVTTISEGAFIYNNITSVNIPSNINMEITSNYFDPEISDSFSFAYVIGNSKIGGTYTSLCQDCVWKRGSYVSASTPSSCFTYTSTATNVTITGYVDGCPSYVKIPEYIDGKPVQHIGYRAFYGQGTNRVYKNKDGVNLLAFNDPMINEKKEYNLISLALPDPSSKLKYIELPSTLISIGEEAFSNNNLGALVLPESIQTIGMSAFDNNYLYSIYIPDNVTIEESYSYPFSNFIGSYLDYYNKKGGLYRENGCNWINTNSSLPIPECIPTIY